MYKGFKDTEKKGNKDEPVIDNKVRNDWNNYVSWLDKKGMKGHPSLDKNGLWNKMIEKYREENPNTVITKDIIVPIQKDFDNYRKYSLDQVKSGKLLFDEGVDENNFMKNLSVVDGIAGQRTTSFQYPMDYLKTLDKDDKVIKVENKGFVIPKEK